jgi:hypothetical protein
MLKRRGGRLIRSLDEDVTELGLQMLGMMSHREYQDYVDKIFGANGIEQTQLATMGLRFGMRTKI